MDSQYDIFISYRRKGGYETAKHLFDLLKNDGYKVSFDIDTLRNGDFDTALFDRIDKCTDFILILSEGALDRTVDPTFARNKDWMRMELARALEKDKNVIPVMLSGFTEFPENLPDDVARVQRKNGPKYDQYYFDQFYDKLKKVFLESKPSKPVPTNDEYSLTIKTDETSLLTINGEASGKVKGGKPRVLRQLVPGKKYDIRLTSLAVKGDTIEIEHLVDGTRMSDLIEVNFGQRRLQQKNNAELERKRKEMEKVADYERKGRLDKCLEMYDKSFDGGDGMTAVMRDDKWGFVNEEGFETTPCAYNGLIQYNEDIAYVCTGPKMWIAVDRYGSIHEELWSEIPTACFGGLIQVCRQGRHFMIDVDGRKCTENSYDAIVRTSDPKAILAKTAGKYMLIDALTCAPLLKTVFDSFPGPIVKWGGIVKGGVRPGFYEFPLQVSDNGLIGFINSHYRLSIPFIADKVDYDNGSRQVLHIRGKYALIDAEEGRYILPPIYDYMCYNYWSFEGMDFVHIGVGCDSTHTILGGQQGVTDTCGNIIVPMIYQTITYGLPHEVVNHGLKGFTAMKWIPEGKLHYEHPLCYNEKLVWDIRPQKLEEFYFDLNGNTLGRGK